MIVVMLNGGLGNQMFQYAFGRAVSFDLKCELKLDLSWFENIPTNDTVRKYELDCFNFNALIATHKEIVLLKKTVPFLSQRLLNYLYRKFPIMRHSFFKERFYNYDPLIEKCSDNTYFEGYWQSYKYFDRHQEVIRKDFIYKEKLSFESKELLAFISEKNAVSLHVRRGDYVTNSNANSFHGLMPLKYYADAIEYLQSRVENIHIFVFSDDAEWVQENLDIKTPVTFVTNTQDKKPFEDIFLMSQCEHNIIANSSFSWWGAYLNGNESKIVIAPKQWFADTKINTTDLIPPSWIRL